MEVLQTLGKYEIRGTLGRGAMGIVYDGWDPRIERRVAIKAVRLPDHPDPETQDEIARFRREAQAAGRLTHPNIVGVYDYGETADLAYIVMEFVDGTTLKASLDRQERFALPEIQRIMHDLLTGLQYSHQCGVVHRDIKPANVILTSSRQAKIADFGIARIESSSLTQVGTVMGTPAYMSPEQFMGQVVDERTDIYSSGVLLYQLLTGERPFDGGTAAIMHKVLNSDPPLPSELANTSPIALDAVVRRAMAKRPDDRYPSATAFAEAIVAAIAPPPAAVPEVEATMVAAPGVGLAAISVRPQSKEVAGPRAAAVENAGRRSRAPVPAIAAGALGLAVLAGGGLWLATRTPHPTRLASSAGTVEATVPAVNTAPASSNSSRTDTSGSSATVASGTVGSGASPQSGGTVPANASPGSAGGPALTKPPVPAAAPSPPSGSATALPQTQTAPVAPSPPAATAPQTRPVAPVAVAPAPSAPAAVSGPSQPASPKTQPVESAPVTRPPPASGTSAAALSPPAAGPVKPQPVEPTQTAPLPTPPPTEQVAGIELGQFRQGIERALAAARCATVSGVVQDSGTVSVTGLAGRAADDTLRREVTDLAGSRAVDWRVHRVDRVFCDALAAIRPVSVLAGAADQGLRLGLAGDKAVLRDGDLILPRVTMADFAGQLRVDYLAHDNSLIHLFPTVADPAQHVVAVPARTLRPGERFDIGDNPWGVGPPYGTDMIIAVASSVPLFDHPPTRNIEDNASEYLRRLQLAIETALHSGASVTGTVMLVDTLPP